MTSLILAKYRSLPCGDHPACHYTARCEELSFSFGRGYDYDEWRATTENISGWYSAGYVVCQQCVPFIGLWCKGSCGQCRCQVLEGGGEILPTETGFFSRKEQADHWRLGCQVKVKQDMSIKIDESILGVKEWECEVISNKNVATFIKEFIVALPPGEHMDFVPGSYAQIKIPTFSMDYDKDIDQEPDR